MAAPGGKIAHAEISIGDSVIMMSDEEPHMDSKAPRTVGTATGGVMLYVKDCDRVFAQAITAGAAELMKPVDMFWGDRYSKVRDPFGHLWGIATHTKDMTPKQVERAQQEFVARMAQGGGWDDAARS
jgi:PhnB protein